MDKDSMNNFIETNLKYPGGDTNTTGALEMAKDRIFGQAGDRNEIPNVSVLLTDGIPTYPLPNPR